MNPSSSPWYSFWNHARTVPLHMRESNAIRVYEKKNIDRGIPRGFKYIKWIKNERSLHTRR